MTKGLITLLFKQVETFKLANWRAIIVLKVTYKIYTNALQLWPQLVLREVISLDQTIFFPF